MPFDYQQIKEFPRAFGLTQTQLAKKLQVPQCTIARWETGKTAPNASHIGEMCDFGRVRRASNPVSSSRLQPLYSGESTTIIIRSLKWPKTPSSSLDATFAEGSPYKRKSRFW